MQGSFWLLVFKPGHRIIINLVGGLVEALKADARAAEVHFHVRFAFQGI